MSWTRSAGLALLSLTLPPSFDPPSEPPLPLGEARVTGPIAAEWAKRSATVVASRVRLNSLGVRTHTNWVLFRLPFDATQRDRIRHAQFTPRVSSPTDVGALRIGSLCVPVGSNGGADAWTLYTASGIGWTQQFRWHFAAPTSDPTIVAINVPTRVANYAACGWDDGRLRDPGTWALDISWEER